MGQGILLSAETEVDFMIHGVFSYELFGQTVWITTTHICVLIVMLIIIGFCIAANRAIKHATEVPGGFQNVVELIVEKLDGMIEGGADKSYGIQVAKLAGVPEVVLARAKEIAAELSEHDINVTAAADIMPKILEDTTVKGKKGKQKDTDGQMSLFGNAEESSVVADIKALDLSNMTPMKALLYLNDLQERLK